MNVGLVGLDFRLDLNCFDWVSDLICTTFRLDLEVVSEWI